MIASFLRHPWGRPAGFAAGLLAALLSAGCTKAPAPQASKAVEVVVTRPITDEVTDYQDFTGRLDAVKTVEIRARVSGYIIEAPFKEGDEAHKGDLLFQIDPSPYQAALNAAEAQVAAAKAQIAVAESNVKMANITLNRARAAGSAATALELDQDRIQTQVTQANLKLAEGNLGTALANLETAKLNMGWTKVRAPFDGRISRRNVDPGNLVNADMTSLTTVVTTDPVYGYFDVDERTYLDLVGSSGGSQSSWFSALRFPVLMRLANEEEFAHAGLVNFLDNRLNGNTGTIRMRAEFKNDKGTLKPGLFVRIRLPLGRPYNAILIPDEALLSDQGRKYVYVVTKDDEAKYRLVTPGQSIQGLRVIKKGLSDRERVIIGGVQKVRRDTKVQVKEEAPPEPPHSSPGKVLSLDKPAEAGGADAKK
jgi:RND family efflux transporter MFP subunit